MFNAIHIVPAAPPILILECSTHDLISVNDKLVSKDELPGMVTDPAAPHASRLYVHEISQSLMLDPGGSHVPVSSVRLSPNDAVPSGLNVAHISLLRDGLYSIQPPLGGTQSQSRVGGTGVLVTDGSGVLVGVTAGVPVGVTAGVFGGVPVGVTAGVPVCDGAGVLDAPGVGGIGDGCGDRVTDGVGVLDAPGVGGIGDGDGAGVLPGVDAGVPVGVTDGAGVGEGIFVGVGVGCTEHTPELPRFSLPVIHNI